MLPETSSIWLLRLCKSFHRSTMRMKVVSSSWRRGVVTQQQPLGFLNAHSQSHPPQGSVPVQLAVCENTTLKRSVSFTHWQKNYADINYYILNEAYLQLSIKHLRDCLFVPLSMGTVPPAGPGQPLQLSSSFSSLENLIKEEQIQYCFCHSVSLCENKINMHVIHNAHNN